MNVEIPRTGVVRNLSSEQLNDWKIWDMIHTPSEEEPASATAIIQNEIRGHERFAPQNKNSDFLEAPY